MTSAARSRSPFWVGIALTLLLALYWVMAVSTSPRMGVTGDEPVHLAGGYSYWKFNDYRMQPENGTLAMRVAALPLLGMHLNWVPETDKDWRHAFANWAGYKFLFKLNNPLDRMLLASRAAIALFGVFTIWLIWQWTDRVFGRTAAWIAAVLAAFSPTLLAHGALATSDMAITACLFAVVTTFWRLLHIVTWARLATTIVAGGAVLLAKMSGVLAAPMLLLLLAIRCASDAPLVIRLGGGTRWIRRRGAIVLAMIGIAGAVTAGSLVLLWAGYGFRYSAFSPKHREGAQFYFSWAQILDQEQLPDAWTGKTHSLLSQPLPPPQPNFITRTIGWARDHRLLPEAYLWGFAHTYKFSRRRPAFLDGQFSLTGWHRFFPIAFLEKTTLPVLILFAAGIWCVAMGGSKRRRWLYRLSPLIVLFTLYWAVALETKLNIGHRHILPTYPVVFVFAGAATMLLRMRHRKLIAIGLALAVAAHATDSLLVRPFYLSYFQPFCGGPLNGWRHLVDSSYDWGQGLPDLQRWLQARGPTKEPVYLTYFGADSPEDRHLPVTRFADEVNDNGFRVFPVRPRGGWFAISATHFQRVYLHLQGPWNSERERLYQELRVEMDRPNPPTPDETSRLRLLSQAMDFEALEFGRLCHFLRNRDPDAVVGGSILLFHLSDAEVGTALNAPLEILDRASEPKGAD